MDENIRYEQLEGGTLLATIDMPGRSMNVFSFALMDSLERLLDHVETTVSIKNVVITSGKPSFIAGADLEMVNAFPASVKQGSDVLRAHCSRLSLLYRRLEKSPKPYVAAINGLALGGGLELTLACHARVVADDPKIQLGLPEVKLGLLPGAGGTQRAPRLIGLAASLPLLLRGRSLSPREALEQGLVDEIVAPDRLIDAARARAARIEFTAQPWERPGYSLRLDGMDLKDSQFERVAAKHVGLSDQELRDYPAFRIIMRCLSGGLSKPIDTGCAWEVDRFMDLIQDPVAGHMIESLFLQRRKADGLFKALGGHKIVTVAIEGDVPALKSEIEKRRIALTDDPVRADLVLRVTANTKHAPAPALAVLSNGDGSPKELGCSIGLYLSPTSEHGRVAEIVVQGSDPAAERQALALARQLGATPYVTRGPTSLLATLTDTLKKHPQPGLDELTRIAENARAAGFVTDDALADSAIVIAGLFPAFTGGPFRRSRQAAR